MLRTLRKYAGIEQNDGRYQHDPVRPISDELTSDEGPIIVWEGNTDEYRSLLVLREAELLLAKAQLTGNNYYDWYVRNRIHDLEIKIADLRRWLKEACENDKD